MLDYLRIGCAVPPVRVGDAVQNAADICAYLDRAEKAGCDVVIFPEMALTGYTCADLFFQETLLRASRAGLAQIAARTAKMPQLVAVVGLPLALFGQLYNCAAVISGGIVRGIVPKSFIPNYNEFYEHRWFSPAEELAQDTVQPEMLGLSQTVPVPVGSDLLFVLGEGAALGIEICEDLWTPLPPSTRLALGGAEVIANLSASNETIGKRAYRRALVKHQSAACACAYAYCSAGCTESTQDLVFSGHSLIAENGTLAAEQTEAITTDYLLVQDVDLGKLRADRRKNKSFSACAFRNAAPDMLRRIDCGVDTLRADGTQAKIAKLPFVPASSTGRRERCMEIFQMQVGGLCQRLRTIGTNAVIGVSGGLDSTLALLVAVEAMHRLKRPLTDVYGVTMPCFGTTDRTYQNSLTLMRTLGVSMKEINIRDAVTTHFRDIGHDPAVLDGTYENSQARERTQVLMDYASVVHGIVIGTGDLSELALGWCTYNGDHMSMYGVNASIPKTLIRWMIAAIAEMPEFAASREVLTDILDTPISPELLPPDAEGKICQQTEGIVGPYALHDFFLYYMLRFGFPPEKTYALACRAFAGDFDAQTIKKWLREFYRRFFSQQFKRSCLPDGVKVGSVCLSPRGDWRMPSDASGRVWLDAVEKL